MLAVILQRCDRNGFSFDETTLMRGATVRMNCTRPISALQYVRGISIKMCERIFSEFDNFQSSTKKQVGGVSCRLHETYDSPTSRNIMT